MDALRFLNASKQSREKSVLIARDKSEGMCSREVEFPNQRGAPKKGAVKDNPDWGTKAQKKLRGRGGGVKSKKERGIKGQAAYAANSRPN